MKYTYLKDQEDFLEFIDRLFNEDQNGSIESFLRLIGGNFDKLNNLDDDKDVGSILDYQPFDIEPKQYPAIAVQYFENGFDRYGKYAIELLEFLDLEELKTKKVIDI